MNVQLRNASARLGRWCYLIFWLLIVAGFTNERISSLINQIASNHAAYDFERAASLIAEHVNLFWEPGMREHLAQLLADQETSKALSPLALAAAQQVDGAGAEA